MLHARCGWWWWWLRLCVLLGAVLALVGAAPRKEIDYDALEKAWEADDAPEEARSYADDQYDRLNSMPPQLAKAMGPQMVFVTLETHEPLSELASRWKGMLWNGGVDVNIYEIEASKVLVGLQKGLFVRDLRLFLHQQREVVTYDLDGKTYTRDDPIEKEATAPTSLPNKSKKKKKTNRKTKKTHATTRVKPTHDGF